MNGEVESDRLGDAPHPRETSDLFGHAGAEHALLEAYRSGRLPHAWLIGGPKGIGKATLAWRFTRFLLAHPDPAAQPVREAASLAVAADHPVARRLRTGALGDVAVLKREWNDKTKKPFSEIRVDDVRAALGLFQRAAGAGGYRIGIIDSADELNRSSANALLKAIEEPPPRSVFLIVSHQPSQILPTILSRCRKLFLRPLAAVDVAAALRTLPTSGDAIDPSDLQAAIERSGGSVGRALRLMDEARRGFDRDLAAELARLPAVDARALHRLADRLGPADQDALATVLDVVLEWIDGRLIAAARAGAPTASLAPLAEVWEKIASAAREADALNLDKRPLILSMFADLSTASRLAGRTEHNG